MIKLAYLSKVHEEIDTTALEVGDKFTVVKRHPWKVLEVKSFTVSKIGARDIICESTSGEKYRFNKNYQESDCYPVNSDYVKSVRLEIKTKNLLSNLFDLGFKSVDKELLDALEAWDLRQKAKIPPYQER